jgi:hypothetical protein
LQGILIIFGGPERWQGPGLSVINRLPGSPTSWALWALGSGVLVIFGLVTRQWKLKAVGLVSFSVWCAAFSVGAFGAAITIDTVAPTGGPTYLAMAVLIALLVGYRDSPGDGP